MSSSRRRIRLALFLVLAAGTWYRQQRRGSAREPAFAVPWPPLPPDPTAFPTPPTPLTPPSPADPASEAPIPADLAAWVEPCDGACPDTHPVKVKLRSGLFHRPGMALYDRTKADRCYSSADEAQADGFRPSSR